MNNSKENNNQKLKNNEEIEILPSTFDYHEFSAQVGEVRMHCHFIKMKDSLYIWIGDAKDPVMDDLSVALMSKYEHVPVSTKLMGAVADCSSINIAKRLSKKTGKQIYVSFNLSVDNVTLSAIEKRIQAEFLNHSEFLSF